MNDQLSQLDSQLLKASDALNHFLTSLKFEEGEKIEFTLGGNAPDFNNDQFNFPGIYFFEIENSNDLPFTEWYNWFEPIWMDQKYRGQFTPSPVKKRVNAHLKNNDHWIPFYVGKSKHVRSRLNTHFNLALEQKTFGLKLCLRTNLYQQNFRVRALNLHTNENYDWIVPKAEDHMRKILNPIIGR